MGRDFKYRVLGKNEKHDWDARYRDWNDEWEVSHHNDSICGGAYDRNRLKEKLVELMEEFKVILSADGDFEDVAEAIQVYTSMLKKCLEKREGEEESENQIIIEYD